MDPATNCNDQEQGDRIVLDDIRRWRQQQGSLVIERRELTLIEGEPADLHVAHVNPTDYYSHDSLSD